MSKNSSPSKQSQSGWAGVRPKATATWPTIDCLPPSVLPLPELDMSRSIGRRPLLEPLNETKFLHELGYYECRFTGSKDAKINKTLHSAVKDIQGLCPDFGRFQDMSTRPEDVFDKVMDKIDQAPRESHQHFNRMWITYKAIADHCLSNRMFLRKQTNSQIISKLRNKTESGCGPQDRRLGYDSVADYIKSGEWIREEARFAYHLSQGKPIKAVWNTVAKLEPKKAHEKTGVRLIWYLCATARIYETRLFAGLDNIVRSLPYSVLGIDLSDYGDLLAELMTDGRHAVCDDIKAWDTRIGYTILCLEAKFLQRLAPGDHNKFYRREIAYMYSIYANPLVSIKRPARQPEGLNHDVLYRMRGQVPSGRRLTYAMNTVTDMVITMCRAAISQGIPERQMYLWVREVLKRGHSDMYGGKICGDDSVIIMSPENALKYATIGAQFMNEIGLPRKNLEPDEPSKVVSSVSGIHFCGNNFVQISFPNKGPTRHTRWMPVAPVGKILSKAILMPKKFDDEDSDKSYAKFKALTLLVRYFHLRTVRLVCEAIFSYTPRRFQFHDKQGCRVVGKPWLDYRSILRMLNERLFGTRTLFPTKYRINEIRQLGYLDEQQRRKYDIKYTSDIYVLWERGLPNFVQNRIREEPLETRKMAFCNLAMVLDD